MLRTNYIMARALTPRTLLQPFILRKLHELFALVYGTDSSYEFHEK